MSKSAAPQKTSQWKLLLKVLNLASNPKSKILLAVVLTLIQSLLTALQPYLYKIIIDDVIVSKQFNLLNFWIAILIVWLLIQTVLGFFNSFLSEKIAQNIVLQLRQFVYNHLIRLKLRFFDKTPVGTAVTRSVSDIQTITDLFSSGLITILGDLVQIIAILSAMLYISWKLTLATLLVIPLLLYSANKFRKGIRDTFQDVRNQVSALNAFLQERITGMSTVQIFNQEERQFYQFQEINKKHRDANIRSVFYYSIFFPIVEVLVALAFAIIIGYGTILLFNLEIQLGAITAFIMFVNLFFRPIRAIADRFNNIQMGVVAAERIFNLIDDKENIEDLNYHNSAYTSGTTNSTDSTNSSNSANPANSNYSSRSANTNDSIHESNLVNPANSASATDSNYTTLAANATNSINTSNSANTANSNYSSRSANTNDSTNSSNSANPANSASATDSNYTTLAANASRSSDPIFNSRSEFASPENKIIPKHLKGKIEFNRVFFRYNEGQWILKDLSFSVRPGESLALVGKTGSGKTSIAGLITQLYNHQQGEIRIDDILVNDFHLPSLRQKIAFVLQDVFLFSGSIQNNLTLNNSNIPLNDLVDISKQIGAYEFIHALPGGFDYNVQERGMSLSTGQRQLISFIRALAANPDIIILDEATSSVDTQTEQMIQKAIEILLKGRTAIVIAHRLSTIKNCDTILVLNQGEIEEQGSHDELMQKNGAYRELVEQYQSASFESIG